MSSTSTVSTTFLSSEKNMASPVGGNRDGDLQEPDFSHQHRKKEYCCPICKKSFRLASTLSRHKDIHSDEKRFVCGACGRSFRQQSGLATHYQKKHIASEKCPANSNPDSDSIHRSLRPKLVRKTPTTTTTAMDLIPGGSGQQCEFRIPVKLSRTIINPTNGLKSVEVLSQTGLKCFQIVRRIPRTKFVRTYSNFCTNANDGVISC